MLETKPQELRSWQDLVAGTRFIVEPMLFAWLQNHNVEQGLAPSRSQLVEQALANVHLLAPEDDKGLFEHHLGKLRPKPTEMASQIPPAVGGSAGHVEALQHFVFEGEAEQGSEGSPRCPKCSFVSISRGLFLSPFFSATCVVRKA